MKLENESTRGDAATDGHWRPRALSLRCPSCSERGVFSLESCAFDPKRRTIAANAFCPGCEFEVFAWVVDPAAEGKTGCSSIFVHPDPARPRPPVRNADALPEKVRASYLEALDVLNANILAAVPTACRRTIETIVKQVVPRGKQETSLAQNMAQVTHNTDLSRPIVLLSNAVRKGGNIGALFEREKTITPQTAADLIDIVEYFLEYVYLAPEMIDRLNQGLGSAQGIGNAAAR